MAGSLSLNILCGEDIVKNFYELAIMWRYRLLMRISSLEVWYGTTRRLKHAREEATTGCGAEIPNANGVF